MIDEIIKISIDSLNLNGTLNVPDVAKGIVIFVHGSGSGRFSERDTFVARKFQKQGVATLLFDLLTDQEDKIYENRFDIDLLAMRLKIVTDWIENNNSTKNLKIGYFGASTGSAAAIKAAAELDGLISAVVSRGGRVDMASAEISKLKTPTMLIVGGSDEQVLEFNETVFDKIEALKKLEIVNGATHLFSEPGALEQVAELATDWFKKYLK